MFVDILACCTLILTEIRPEVLFLFVLSHGRERGVVLTSHVNDVENQGLDSYLTSELWDALCTDPTLNNCPKILFLAVNIPLAIFVTCFLI
jgi:hypothetical protein